MNTSSNFNQFLKRIESSREQALKILACHGPHDEVAEAALITVWQMVFERLMYGDDHEIEKMASLLQRLWSSINVRKGLMLKEREDRRKDEDHQARKETIRQALYDVNDRPTAIDDETLALIESELKLL